MSKEKSYKAIIAPSSEDKGAFENASDFNDALKIYSDKKEDEYPSMSLHEFETRAELEAFVEGFDAGIGWLGDETIFTNT